MKRFATLAATAFVAIALSAGCEKSELGPNMTAQGEGGYLPFPQDTSEIPDPDTLEFYPYDPNCNIPITFSALAYTDYPEPDSSEVDSADWAIWIPKSEVMMPISEFLTLERMIPAETTLVRFLEEGIEEDTTGGKASIMGNNCNFSNNRRGDILLTQGKWYLHFYGFWTHSLMWLRSTGNDLYKTITAHWDPNDPSRNGVHYEKASSVLAWYRRCAVFRVTTDPWPKSLCSRAGDYAEAQLGKPYNFLFNWKYRQDKFYCSQLDWAGYYWRSDKDVDVDINVPCYVPKIGLVPDWHVFPDELWLSWRTYLIAIDPPIFK